MEVKSRLSQCNEAIQYTVTWTGYSSLSASLLHSHSGAPIPSASLLCPPPKITSSCI